MRNSSSADADTTVDGLYLHTKRRLLCQKRLQAHTHETVRAIGDITDADSNTVETGVVEPDTLEDGHTWTGDSERSQSIKALTNLNLCRC